MSIPKDGYYIAVVQCDSGGETVLHVRVLNGVPQTVRGDALVQSACSQFMEVSASEFCRVWRKDAAMELDALRAANAGLVEKVKRLEEWKASVVAIEAKWDAQAIAAMLGSRLGESTRTAIQREVPLLLGRVKQLHAAGQDAIDYIDGKHRDAGRVLDGWRKASE